MSNSRNEMHINMVDILINKNALLYHQVADYNQMRDDLKCFPSRV